MSDNLQSEELSSVDLQNHSSTEILATKKIKKK
jgi:hypothetical protein